MSTPESRLSALNIVLPTPVAPVANYVPFVRHGDLIHISGQVSFDASGNYYWCYAPNSWARIGPAGYSNTF